MDPGRIPNLVVWLLNQWLYAGRNLAADHSQRRKIFQTNFGSLLAVATLVFFITIFLFAKNHALIKTAWFLSAMVPMFLLVPVFNCRSWSLVASWLYCLLITSTILGVIFVAEGTLLEAYYYFMMFAFVPLAFFPVRRLGSILFLFCLNLSLFLYFRFVGWAPAPEMLTLNWQTLRTLQVLHIVLAVSSLLVFMFFSESTAETNERQLEALSMLDSLTELLNRRGAVNQFTKVLARTRRAGGRGALLFLDLDQFKTLNDEHGHAMGDQLLIQVARRIRASVRGEDVVARFGGDEFLVLVDSLDSDRAVALGQAEALAEKLRAELEKPYLLEAHGTTVAHTCTASLGVVPFDGGSEVHEVIKRADEAMYLVKQTGRNGIQVDSRGLGEPFVGV